MQKFVCLTQPRRAFMRVNIALTMCALSLASITMASKAKEALAYGPEDGVCANVIGTANCPDGYIDNGFNPGGARVTCHSSTAWYAFPNYGPYYNCCTYLMRFKDCLHPTYGYPIQQSAEYFRSSSNGSATCVGGPDGPDSQCLDN